MVSAIAPLLVVPVALSSLGRTTYGIWMTAAGLTAFLTFADLGLGNALMTRLGGLRRPGDDAAVRRALSVTYRVVLTVSLVAVAVVVVLWQLTPWEAWLGRAATPYEARPIVLICLLAFLLNVPAAMIMRVQFGLQEPGSGYLWQCAGPLVSLVGAYVCWWSGAPDAVFVLAAVTGPLVGNLACTAWWFSRNRSLRPVWAEVARDEVVSVLGVSSRFLLITLLTAVTMNLDVLLIPRYLAVGDVTDFSVPWRVMAQLGSLVALASLPMWPASAHALARGELPWVRRRVTTMVGLNLALVGPPGVLIVAFAPQLLRLWLGDAVQPDRMLVAGFAAWWCLIAVMTPFVMVQNAAGVTTPQVCGWAALLTVGVVAKVAYLDATADIRLLPWISVAVYVLTVVPAVGIGYRTAMRRRSGPQPSADPRQLDRQPQNRR